MYCIMFYVRLYSAVQSQKAVTAYFSSEQLLPFVFAERYRILCKSVVFTPHQRLQTHVLRTRVWPIDLCSLQHAIQGYITWGNTFIPKGLYILTRNIEKTSKFLDFNKCHVVVNISRSIFLPGSFI